MTGPANPERNKQLRITALEHLEAARGCIDETGDATSNYLIERAINELTSQLYPSLDPFSENWPTKKPPRKS